MLIFSRESSLGTNIVQGSGGVRSGLRRRVTFPTAELFLILATTLPTARGYDFLAKCGGRVALATATLSAWISDWFELFSRVVNRSAVQS